MKRNIKTFLTTFNISNSTMKLGNFVITQN